MIQCRRSGRRPGRCALGPVAAIRPARPAAARNPAPTRPPPFASKSPRNQHALVVESAKPTRQPVERFGSSNSMDTWTFIAWPDDMISIARNLAGGRRDFETENVQSGAQNQFRSHKCGPLRTFQFEQLQWWGQRPDRGRGGGGPEALFRFPPRLGTFSYQSISETRATSKACAPARETAKASTWR